ncbi:MAG: hypothetical protein DRI34_02910 [Deltaproteobacteria bacterium]|nr:MAG: hypothetical protein DRI34_02910 [Deltaproteobacteria bacterium]
MAEREHILRIGVIRAGKIIEEKLVRKRTTVTVGNGSRNTIVLPSADVPKSFPLFELRGGDYYLTFTDSMTGRISAGEEAAADLKAIKAQQQLPSSSAGYLLRLNPSSRGRVSMGDFILLFQFVLPPPEPVKTQLPQVARGYWTKNIDWPYTTSFSLTMTFMIVIWIWSANVPIIKKEPSIDDIPDRFAKLIMPDKEMIKKPDEGQGAGTGADEGPKRRKKKKKAGGDNKGENKNAGKGQAKVSAAARRAAMEKKVAGRGLLRVLGARGAGGVAVGGAVADVFGDGSVGGTGDGAFDGIGGVDVASAAGQQGTRGMDGAAQAASIQDMGTRGVVGNAGRGGRGKTEARVVARVTSAALEDFDSDSRDQQQIVKRIRRRLGGIKHCYEKRLKRNPQLQGKIVIRFVIHPGGRVIEVEVVENSTGDSELAACIAARVKAIRFPPTDGGETSVTYPFILAPGG